MANRSANKERIADIQKNISKAVCAVRDDNPLTGSVTNNVTIDFVANAQLAVGGSAAMVYLADEAQALVQAGSAFYINMGTLMPVLEETMPAAAEMSKTTSKPWVLDPVAIGIGSLRTNILRSLQRYKPSIIRGNASEIIALAGLWGVLSEQAASSRPKGVDSIDDVASARSAALALARSTGGAVAVSGAEDLVTDGVIMAYSQGGSTLMNKVTGFGCSLGGVCAVYAAQTDSFTAALAAVNHYNAAGTLAASKTNAPASFKAEFIDALYQLSAKEIANNPFRVEEA